MEQNRVNNNAAFNGVANNPYTDSRQYNAFDGAFASTSNQDPNYGDANWAVSSEYSQQDPSHVYQQQQWHAQDQQNAALLPNYATQHHGHDDTLRNSPIPTNVHFAQQPGLSNYGSLQAGSPYQSQQQTHAVRQHQQHQPQHTQHQQPQYDPSLLQAPSQAFKQYSSYQTQLPETTTVAPRKLEHDRGPAATQLPISATSSLSTFDQGQLIDAVPSSNQHGSFHIITFEKLSKATNSERLSAYANIAREPVEWAINRAALPVYVPRKSKNALKRLAGGDTAILSKINSKGVKKHRRLNSSSKGVKSSGNLSSARTDRAGVNDSSENDDSDFTSDSDVDEMPISSKRPEGLRESIEYDTIKALWRSKRKSITANDIRQGLVDFWELIKTIRDRWKADGAAVAEAEAKGRKGELPLLRQRVKDQRDLFEVAFKTALKHANRTILENLSENTPLIFVCYQFLLDRLKADDVNGSLARIVLEAMALFTTLTSEKMDKTFLAKVLPRYIKNGDAKTQYYARAITSKAVANTEAAKAVASLPAPDQKSANQSPLKAAQAVSTKQSTSGVEQTISAKKPVMSSSKSVANAGSQNNAKKKALDPGASQKALPKKPLPQSGVSDGAAKPKPSANKLTTGLYAGLQSAAKKTGTSVKTSTSISVKDIVKPSVTAPAPAPSKPAFSFADTMKSLTKSKEEKAEPKAEKAATPKEHPEQRARRLRREARGPLRVHWKFGDDLVQIKEFVHDPEEELGHDSSQTRDVTDLKGEGRMFKQQHNSMMDIDEDEEDPAAVNVAITDEGAMGKMVDWYEPNLVDHSVVDEEERKRNYAPYGGGRLYPESAEQVEREKYESSTLMVFYTQPEDIPPDPREPSDPINGEKPAQTTNFGAPKQEYFMRAQSNRASQPDCSRGMQAASIDFNMLRNVVNGQPQTSSLPPGFQPPAQTPDLAAILAQLNGGKASQPPQQQWPAFVPPPPSTSAQSNGQVDISAILAQLKGGTQPQQAPQPQAMPPMPFFNDPARAADFQAFVQRQLAAGNTGGMMPGMAPPAAANNGIYENPERKRMRDVDDDDDESEANRKKAALYKTKICKYYHEGKCAKGDNCSFLHT